MRRFGFKAVFVCGTDNELRLLLARVNASIDMVTAKIRLDHIIAAHLDREGPLLPILNDVQANHGFIDEAAIRAIALALNVSRAEVYGVVSFYHDYRTTPTPHQVLKLCRAEACQARGVEALDTSDPRIETVYCLGLCSVGPAAMVGGVVHARLDQAKLDTLVAAL
jgi:formate dehydrogenase subunit gamma